MLGRIILLACTFFICACTVALAAEEESSETDSICEAAQDCCHQISWGCLELHSTRHCPPPHQCVVPQVPGDCREPLQLCHMPVEPCMPCGVARVPCACHKPAVPVEVADCGDGTAIEVTGDLGFVTSACDCALCVTDRTD